MEVQEWKREILRSNKDRKTAWRRQKSRLR